MSVDGFLRELRGLRVSAGNPSLGVLSRRTGIPRSTLFDALNPKRVTLPAWETVRSLVAALDKARDDAAGAAVAVPVISGEGGPAGSLLRLPAQAPGPGRAWFEAEWPCLVAAIAAARQHGRDRLAFDLSFPRRVPVAHPTARHAGAQPDGAGACGAAERRCGPWHRAPRPGPDAGDAGRARGGSAASGEALDAFGRAGDALERGRRLDSPPDRGSSG